MNSVGASPDSTPRVSRSLFVTALGWVAIVFGALLLPISFISAIMVAQGAPGTSESDPLGYFTVVFGPLLIAISGIGLVLRKAWGRYLLLALLLAIMPFNAYNMLRTPHEPRTFIAPSGVKTTILDSKDPYAATIFVTSLVLVVGLLTPRVRREFASARRPS